MNNKELLQEINKKEMEIFKLHEQYNTNMEAEKNIVMKSKGFNKVLYLLNCEFESSSSRTSQYLEFHGVFKKEFKRLLLPYIEEIEISKPNHFDVSGFFKLKSGSVYYISIGDLRWDKETMLIRTATDFKDYTGGSNCFINLDKNFVDNLLKFLEV